MFRDGSSGFAVGQFTVNSFIHYITLWSDVVYCTIIHNYTVQNHLFCLCWWNCRQDFWPSCIWHTYAWHTMNFVSWLTDSVLSFHSHHDTFFVQHSISILVWVYIHGEWWLSYLSRHRALCYHEPNATILHLVQCNLYT